MAKATNPDKFSKFLYGLFHVSSIVCGNSYHLIIGYILIQDAEELDQDVFGSLAFVEATGNTTFEPFKTYSLKYDIQDENLSFHHVNYTGSLSIGIT